MLGRGALGHGFVALSVRAIAAGPGACCRISTSALGNSCSIERGCPASPAAPGSHRGRQAPRPPLVTVMVEYRTLAGRDLAARRGAWSQGGPTGQRNGWLGCGFHNRRWYCHPPGHHPDSPSSTRQTIRDAASQPATSLAPGRQATRWRPTCRRTTDRRHHRRRHRGARGAEQMRRPELLAWSSSTATSTTRSGSTRRCRREDQLRDHEAPRPRARRRHLADLEAALAARSEGRSQCPRSTPDAGQPVCVAPARCALATSSPLLAIGA